MAPSSSSRPIILILDDDSFATMVLTELVRQCFIDGEGTVESCETIEECHAMCAQQGKVYDAVRACMPPKHPKARACQLRTR